MKRTTKKLLALLLAVIMVLVLIPTAVFAEEEDNPMPPVPNGYVPVDIRGSRSVSDAYERGDMETYYRLTDHRRDTLPTSYDSRNYNYVTSVKNQGSYGSCWAHAAMACVESYMIKHGIAVGTGSAATTSLNLSETQHCFFNYSTSYDAEGMLTGDKTTLTDSSAKNGLDCGGNGEFSAYTLMRWTGAASESVSALSYSKASTVASSGLNSQYAYGSNICHVQNSVWVPSSNIEGVKRAIMEYGAGNISYCAGTDYTTYSNTYQCVTDTSSSPNHAITVIGWDDSISKSNFKPNQPSGNGAWLCKNSWGTSQFNQGYMWISYEDASVINSGYIFFYDAEPIDNYDHNYQYDGTCNPACYGKGYNSSTEWYEGFANNSKIANVFTANGTEMLRAIAFCNWDEALTYTVDIYKNPTTGNPSSGTHVSGASGYLVYSGYYTIELDTPVLLNAGDTFSVVITQSCETADDNGKYIHTPYDATFNNSDYADFVNWTHKNHGNTSYYQEPNGNWTDCPDNGDYRIKAYTDDYEVTYTVNAVSNNDSYGTVSVTGTIITATPATGYYVESADVIEGTATVTVNGNTISVAPESDCTVRVNFAPKPSYTVNFVASGNAEGSQTAYLNDAITLPSSVSVNPDGWTFMGWVDAQLAETTDAPAFYAPGASYTVTGNTTLYALYNRVDSNGGEETVYELVTSTPSDWSGNYVITNSTTNLNTSGLYILKGITGTSNGADAEVAENCTEYASSGITLSDNKLYNVTDTYVMTIGAQSSYYTIRSVDTGCYYGMNSSSYLRAYSSVNSTYCRWTPGINANGVAQFKNAANGSYPYFSWSTSYKYFWSGSSGNANVLRLWKENQISSAVTYYTTDPAVSTYAVEIVSDSATFQYDGTLRTQQQYTVTVNGEAVEANGLTFTLPTGDTLTITPSDKAAVTHVKEGTVENTFEYAISGNEDQYTVTAVYGTLTVTPRPVEIGIIGNHDTVVYDGTRHDVKDYSIACEDEVFMSAYPDTIWVHIPWDPNQKSWIALGTDPGTYYMGMTQEAIARGYLGQKDTGENAPHFTDDFDPTLTLIEDGYLEIIAGPEFKSQSLLLEGKIGVRFYVCLPEIEGYEYTGVDFTITGKDGDDCAATVPFSSELPTNSSGYYGFTYYVGVIQMADTITATLNYTVDGEAQTLEKTYSVKEYFEAFDANYEAHPELYTDANVVELIKATADLGHYVQAYLDASRSEWSVPTDHAAMDKVYEDNILNYLDDAATAVASHALAAEGSNSDIKSLGYALIMDSDTTIRVTIVPKSGFTGTITATVDGEAVEVNKISKVKYAVDIPNVQAHELSTKHTIVITTDNGTVTLTGSGLSFVKILLDAYTTDDTVQKAAVAIWRYSQFADIVKGNTPQANKK